MKSCHIFAKGGLLNCIKGNPFRVKLQAVLMRLPKSSPQLQPHSEFQLDLEIALNGVLATSNPAAYSAVPKMR
jgi:hypothetical protein